MLSRVLGGIGKLMICAGVLILLFVAFQLWGTGLQTRQAQDRLRADFDQQLAEARAQIDGSDGTATTSTPTADTAPTTVPASTTPAAADDPAEQLATAPPGTALPAADVDLGYQWGDPIGRIVIDRIGADFVYIEGVDLSLLTDGPGHFPTTAWPGQTGNAALAGHRTTYMAPFNRIDELAPGDLISITTVQGEFTYAVMAQPDGSGHRIVSPDAVEITEDKGDNRLTLMACHPKYDLKQRIVVEAKLVGNPAPTTAASTTGELTELPSLGEGDSGQAQHLLASGDETQRVPALLWSLAALALWFAAWLVGRLWPKVRWPAYLVALPFFLFLLWQSFEHINRALPGAY